MALSGERNLLDGVQENTFELHYPGMNYMGPGTHIVSKVMNRVKPTSFHDELALQHDIDYLKAAGTSTYDADIKAISKAITRPNLQGLSMAAGLGSKVIYDYLMGPTNNYALHGRSIPETRLMGSMLDNIVKANQNAFAPPIPPKFTLDDYEEKHEPEPKKDHFEVYNDRKQYNPYSYKHEQITIHDKPTNLRFPEKEETKTAPVRNLVQKSKLIVEDRHPGPQPIRTVETAPVRNLVQKSKLIVENRNPETQPIRTVSQGTQQIKKPAKTRPKVYKEKLIVESRVPKEIVRWPRPFKSQQAQTVEPDYKL